MIENIEVFTQNSIRIRTENKNVYIDPFQMKETPKDADFILITHDHYDHFSPEDINKVAVSNTRFVVPAKMVRDVKGLDVDDGRIIVLNPGEKKEIKDRRDNIIKVSAVPAYNKAKPFHPKSSRWCGYVVEIDNTTLYVAGDTDGLNENESIECDIAFIPIGGTYTMNYKEAAEFTNKLKPKTVIPIHYGSIVGEKSYGERFEELVDDNINVVRKLF